MGVRYDNVPQERMPHFYSINYENFAILGDDNLVACVHPANRWKLTSSILEGREATNPSTKVSFVLSENRCINYCRAFTEIKLTLYRRSSSLVPSMGPLPLVHRVRQGGLVVHFP